MTTTLDKLPPTLRPTCGTAGGRQVHWKNGEDPCEPCILARRAQANALYAKDPQKHMLRQRGHTLKKRYGLTLEDYDAMLAAQGGVCAICSGADPGRGYKYFSVDHDHLTGAVRELLCHQCNVMIGNAKDKVENLESAIRYLKRHQ
jgi:hypothetical protein